MTEAIVWTAFFFSGLVCFLVGLVIGAVGMDRWIGRSIERDGRRYRSLSVTGWSDLPDYGDNERDEES